MFKCFHHAVLIFKGLAKFASLSIIYFNDFDCCKISSHKQIHIANTRSSWFDRCIMFILPFTVLLATDAVFMMSTMQYYFMIHLNYSRRVYRPISEAKQRLAGCCSEPLKPPHQPGIHVQVSGPRQDSASLPSIAHIKPLQVS